MSDEIQWVTDSDRVSGVQSEYVKLDETPSEYSGGVIAARGEGWSMRAVDRPQSNEWVVVTDCGMELEFISEDDARGLFAVTVRRFGSSEDRDAWLIEREREQRSLMTEHLNPLPRRPR